VNPGGTLLLCIDLQPVFIGAVMNGSMLKKRCAFAIAAASGLGIPVLFTEQVPDKLGGTDPALLALVNRPAVHPKACFSALADEGIRKALLGDSGAEHLLLCGLETSICVYQTAVDALREGLAVTLLSDAVGARREGDALRCLDALARTGAHVLPAETVFYAIVRDAAHPYFKAYTQLVKTHEKP
jgi:nicotinamidase-related amidase